jgi:hypothetical protein
MRSNAPIELCPNTMRWAKTKLIIQIQVRNVVKGRERNGGSVARSRVYALASG